MTEDPLLPRSMPWWRSAWLHAVALAVVTIALGLLFLRDPGFGDDLTYWQFAFALQEQGLKIWDPNSFHHLRWPVWGVSWILQRVLGLGFASYCGVALLYLAAGAALAFTFGRMILGSLSAGWLCGVAFFFHPLLDTVSFRPMPDLSEAVWGAATVLAWWKLMHAQGRAKVAGLALLTGACVFIIESNRLTGIFIVPVLLLCTLLYFRPRFLRLVGAGVVAALLYAGLAWFYHGLFGDWLHDLHANLGGKGVKGTEPIPLWSMPFRFIDSLYEAKPLGPIYCVLLVAGLWFSWKRHGVLGRVVVVWLVTLFLEYSCAPQSIWPWRPVIRDGERFLSGITVAMAVVMIVGLVGVWRLPWLQSLRWVRKSAAYPAAGVAAAILLCFVLTDRERLDLGYVPAMRAYMRALPPGTRVFSHSSMRALAFLADSKSARTFTWSAPNAIMNRVPVQEEMAAAADEFWYARKIVWRNMRKNLEKKMFERQVTMGSYFDNPHDQWLLAMVLSTDAQPDLVFFRRRAAEMPPPREFTAVAPEVSGILPPLPVEWASGKKRKVHQRGALPESLRGKNVWVELSAAAPVPEALTARVQFRQGRRVLADYLLKPYLHPGAGKDFFALHIPQEADEYDLELKRVKGVDRVRFENVRFIADAPVSSSSAAAQR
jgi:hypothetical protein